MMASKSKHCLALIVLVSAGLLGARAAWAEPSAADRETARSLMQEGRDLRDKGDLKGALKRFQAADAIMHVPTTGMEVARTQAALGLLIEARDTIEAIRKTPPAPTDPEPFNQARRKAEDLDTELGTRVPALVIVVDGAPAGETPTIAVDGVELPAAVAGFPRKVNPGHHVVTAKTAQLQGTGEVDVAEKGQKEVHVALAPIGSSAPTTPNSDQGPAPEVAAGEEASSHAPTVVTWAGIGVAGAGLLAGAITGILSIAKTHSLSSECGAQKKCTSQPGIGDYNSAMTLATISDVGFVVGGVGAAVAVGSLLIGHHLPAGAAAPAATPPEAPGNPPEDSQSPPPPAESLRVRVIPWIGWGAAGVRGYF